MNAIFLLIVTVIDIYVWMIIAMAIMSWLVAFNVVNRQNRFVSVVGEFLFKITEPVLGPIRRFLPNFGGFDISPIILILVLWFLRNLLVHDIVSQPPSML